jgi:hypothetical protein
VEIETDNAKLNSLLSGPILNHHDYARALLAPLEMDVK